MTALIIRPERPADHEAVYSLTQRAFAPMPYSEGDEQDLIGKLRNAGVLALSLVAEQDAIIVGQVTLSPAFAADGTPGWYALGPISVEPAMQGNGIGGQLISAATEWLQHQNAAGCALVGNPAYYGRFGFLPFPDLVPEGEPAAYYQILPIGVSTPATVVGFHPLFHAA